MSSPGFKNPVAKALRTKELLEEAAAATATTPAQSAQSAQRTPVPRAAGSTVYTPDALVQRFIDEPDLDLRAHAAYFGKPESWIWSVIASQPFQTALGLRRDEVTIPAVTMTFEERFQAVALQALNVISVKMSQEEVTESLLLGAATLSVKALGFGKKGAEDAKPQQRSVQNIAAELETSSQRLPEYDEVPPLVFDPAAYKDDEDDSAIE